MSESPENTVVVIGAGQAGCELGFSLRQQGFAGRIVLVGDEPSLPYRRPPLSKAFLAGEVEAASLLIRSAESYAKQNIECLMGRRVIATDRTARSVQLDDGAALAYTHLVFATGGRPRALPLPGGDAPNVHSIRSIADVERLKAGFRAGQRMVVIGGGYIGLEAAAVGIKAGLDVTVLEAQPRLLARVAVPLMSEFYAAAHRKRGVKVLTGVGIVALEGEGLVEVVVLADGQRLPADLVIVGIGIVPNTRRPPALPSTTASSSMPTPAPPTPRSSPSATARITTTFFSAGGCGWNRYRTPWSTRARPRPRSWARPSPTRPSPGSGPTSSISSCRWSA